jgi:hypothetical protein
MSIGGNANTLSDIRIKIQRRAPRVLSEPELWAFAFVFLEVFAD